MTDQLPVSIDDLAVLGLISRWIPGVRLTIGDRAAARRHILRVGAALGVVEEGGAPAFSGSAAPYQTAVILQAFDAEAARFVGVARPQPPRRIPFQTKQKGFVPLFAPVELQPVVNVNLAEVAELEALPGLGHVSAARVVGRRVARGPYRTLDEVARVARVSKDAFAKASARLVIGDAAPPPPVARAVLEVLNGGLAGLVAALAAGTLAHPQVPAGDAARALVKALDVLADAIEARRFRPRFWRPSPERLTRGSVAMSRTVTIMRNAARDGARGAVIAGGAYLPAVNALIDAARTRIWVTMFFFHVDSKGPGRTLLNRLAAARARGVNVRVILDDDLPGDPHGAHDVNGPAFQALAEAGIPARHAHFEAAAHGKAFVVDDRHVVLGSHNWTASSFYQYDDTSAYLESAALTTNLSGWFERRWRLLAPDEGERAVSLLDLESLSTAQREAAASRGLDDGALFATRAATGEGAAALAADLGWPVDRVTRIAAIARLMQTFRIAEVTAVALVAAGLTTAEAVRAADDAALLAALTNLSARPAPFDGRAIPAGMVAALRGAYLRGVA